MDREDFPEIKMPTRATHARIYQGELSQCVYKELKRLSRQNNTSAQELILDAIGAYLKNEQLSPAVDVELVEISGSRARCYIWLPYDTHKKVELKMKEKGANIQWLVRKSIEAYCKNKRKG
ncbi:MAG: hypothetical protein JRF35_14155 [Deltaproteobacteria bacterium]|nr:hypothetical protein [Deltaproteobacteria bacterium]